ncbi:hypothetical protein Vadar_023086 [Vaccinium darrowii]|uniref:Uncharacterized protein n=1 Tax=Vaccinium darrowii TaxID=229202 RepID=A0ACB7X3R1_9ERIC|nr:hypothetical protein Vadar_023086 [Vaccinium darrowii]
MEITATSDHIAEGKDIHVPREGTTDEQHKRVHGCDVMRTTLGPRGMDKLIDDEKGNTAISNDGATIMKLIDPFLYCQVAGFLSTVAFICYCMCCKQLIFVASLCRSVVYMLLSFNVEVNSVSVLWFETLAAVFHV